jgi:hypothetical protein
LALPLPDCGQLFRRGGDNVVASFHRRHPGALPSHPFSQEATMIHSHDTTPWEETMPGVQQRTHTIKTSPVMVQLAIECTGKINASPYFDALPGHLSIVKLSNSSDHALITVIERSLHWGFQRDENDGFKFDPDARESVEFYMLF